MIYFLGVDGGGTGCRARLTDTAGRVLGLGSGGPANLTAGVAPVIASVLGAARDAFEAAGLGAEAMEATAAGLGLAGANASGLAGALLEQPHPFAFLTLGSDAEIACLGAHRGEDGGILILGTGSQGVISAGGRTQTVGGWGFALSDGGSGAVLGRAALRRALLGHERIASSSPFTAAILATFDNAPERMLAFALKAVPADWARFAPQVFEHAARGDPVARELLEGASGEVTGLIDRMIGLGAERIALMGGLAASYRPHLPSRLASWLVEPQGDALDGALALARASLAREH
ncbi:BadF/BadG/BcrA/BcrD ATPase family protein [Hartmannibacter diazotrophicus]|uniref:BadF/BadG/BcrA/BcrD ATPase family protein n=1 Tax=Hartmannibacter diazotrophicus TaxID=1482074 RepID=UPI001FE3BC9A|nr:BadF/BadG/BcrA/BcrD ATPase family protein [Hartmannibacter diazotrophicus]